MSRYTIFALLLVIPLLACRSIGSREPVDAALGAEITLRPSGRAVLRDRGLEVRFVAVTEDSRCPLDMTCVWAGQVGVRLEIGSRSAGAAPYHLLEGQSAVVEQYRVTVLKVNPDPVSTRKILPAEYRVTLKVDPS